MRGEAPAVYQPGRMRLCPDPRAGLSGRGSLGGNTMKVSRRSRRLARAGGGAALALGMAGAAGAVSAPAQARVTAIVIKSHVVAGWGYNAQVHLGDGTTTDRSTPVQVTRLTGSLRWRHTVTSAWPCGPTARCGPGVTTGRAS